jgi:hypothetical protein
VLTAIDPVAPLLLARIWHDERLVDGQHMRVMQLQRGSAARARREASRPSSMLAVARILQRHI